MKKWSFFFVLLLVLALIPTATVHADIAPPQMPPGANLLPGDESTQVRMESETVVLNIRQDPQDDSGAIANTTATFRMRNLGTEEERMQVRFPLSFVGGGSDGFGNFPEIDGITAKVNGRSVATKREMQPSISDQDPAYIERADMPWAVFDVLFPPDASVIIEVAYMTQGYGYYPYEAFKYILETGAGWKGTIGSADIVVKFPYEATKYNIWLPDETTGYSQTTPGATLSGNQLMWHFDDLEPGESSNIEITLVTPSLWTKVLTESGNVAKKPTDGEAWGRLGKAYKEIAVMAKGYPRNDPVGDEIFQLSRQSYENCLELLPDDALWQFGYADLLWSHYYFNIYFTGAPDVDGILPRLLTALKTSYELDPNNERTLDLLITIESAIPNVVERDVQSGYIFLGLTATPVPPTQYLFVTETPIPTQTLEVVASQTAAPVLSTPTATTIPPEQPTGSPFCGGMVLLVPLLVGAYRVNRRKMFCDIIH
jgi:hypothetical protein